MSGSCKQSDKGSIAPALITSLARSSPFIQIFCKAFAANCLTSPSQSSRQETKKFITPPLTTFAARLFHLLNFPNNLHAVFL